MMIISSIAILYLIISISCVKISANHLRVTLGEGLFFGEGKKLAMFVNF